MPSNAPSYMERETREAPEVVTRFLARNRAALAEIGVQLRKRSPPALLTSARGSSDHAASYFKYLAEIRTGVPCASIGASVVSVYGAKLQARNCVALTISQSGQSPDIVSLQEEARRAGALTIAIVNVEGSPAAKSADICLPLCAGPENSVAATKSFIASLAAGAAIVAAWTGDDALARAIEDIPQALDKALQIAWPAFVAMAREAESLYVLGRGPSLPIAAETALKLKETCAIHAEAYSVAEVMHGPLELLGEGFPVLVYAQGDAAFEMTKEATARMRKMGAELCLVGSGGLPHANTGNPLLEPIAMIPSTYLAIAELARLRGRDPDRPRLLKKVTETT